MSETSEEFDKLVTTERLQEVAEGVGLEARRARYELRRSKVDSSACPEGHEYNAANTYYEAGKTQRRRCLKCLHASRTYNDPTKDIPFGRVIGEE